MCEDDDSCLALDFLSSWAGSAAMMHVVISHVFGNVGPHSFHAREEFSLCEYYDMWRFGEGPEGGVGGLPVGGGASLVAACYLDGGRGAPCGGWGSGRVGVVLLACGGDGRFTLCPLLGEVGEKGLCVGFGLFVDSLGRWRWDAGGSVVPGLP
jgi:hypothetical protein